MRKPTEEYLIDPNPKIGGFIVPLVGPPGVGKTVAITRIGMNHIEENYIPVWRGTKQCQWANFLANDIPVKLWNHETIKEESFQAYIQGNKRKNIDRENIDLQKKGVEIETWSKPKELINNIEHGKINVVNIPGLDGDQDYQKFFFRKMYVDIVEAEIKRDYGDFITNLWDEIGDLFPSQQQLRKPFYQIVRDLPPKLAQLRKNNANLICPAHGTHDMHYYLWKIKSNSIGYMSGAIVKKELSPNVDQKGVNSMSRGDVMMPGPDKEFFQNVNEMQDLEWVPSDYTRKLRLEWKFDIPNLLEEEEEERINPQELKTKTKKEVAANLYENEDLDLTQRDIAELVGISQGSVSNAVS